MNKVECFVFFQKKHITLLFDYVPLNSLKNARGIIYGGLTAQKGDNYN